MNGQIKKSQVVRKNGQPIFLLGLAVILLALSGLATLLWLYRYDLLEYKFRQILAKNGLDSHIEIISADKHKAVLKAVHVSKNGKQILAIERIELGYNFKQVLKGEFTQAILSKPVVNLRLDETGNILDDWIAKPTGDVGFVFPNNGIVIEDAQINWQAPFGGGRIHMSGEAKSASDWDFVYDAPNMHIQKDGADYRFDMKGGIVQNMNDAVTSFGEIKASSLNFGGLETSAAKIDFNLNFEQISSENILINGWAHWVGDEVETIQYKAKKTKLKLDINTVYQRATSQRPVGAFGQFSADWDLSLTDVIMKYQAERRRRARVLTAYDSMSKAPIAMHFADVLPRKLEDLFGSFSAQGQGGIAVDQDGYKLHLKDTFMVTGKHQAVKITSKADEAIVHNKQEKTLQLSADLDWGGANHVHVKNLNVQAESLNGYSVQSVQSLIARLQTNDDWRRQVDGHNLRLSPLDLRLKYTHHSGVQDVRMSGAIDYDGLVPSGVVMGLRTQGIVKVHTATRLGKQRSFKLGFHPKGRVHIQSLTNISGWQARNLSFDIVGADELIRTGETGETGRELISRLNNVKAQIISPDKLRHLEFTADNIKLQTGLGDYPHIWDLGLSKIEIFSQDFPAPGTHIRTPESRLRIEQSANGNLHFTSSHPDTYIETDNVIVDRVNIDLSGSPDDFGAIYAAHKVEFKGGAVPILPMKGTARFVDRKLIGEAVAILPSLGNEAATPIDISFSSRGGRGVVKIDIADMEFTPNGVQPQYLVPALRGKLADVTGRASANFEFSFGGGEGIRSSGSTELSGLDIGTLVGPMSGVKAKLNFNSIFPLKTDGVQSVTLEGFDPGFPMKNGQILFEIIPEGVRVLEAIWPVDDNTGRVYIAPMLWKFDNVENRAAIHIQNLDLGTLLEKTGKDNLSITGKVSGVLPAIINGVDIIIDHGKLAVKDGGVIRLNTSASAAATAGNEYAGHGLKALENLNYRKLEARINGPLDGNVNVDLVVDGNNPDVLNGQKFLFNVGVEGELANIMRNLSKSFSTQENLKRVMGIRAEEAATP